jgi:hypothetical protein
MNGGKFGSIMGLHETGGKLWAGKILWKVILLLLSANNLYISLNDGFDCFVLCNRHARRQRCSTIDKTRSDCQKNYERRLVKQNLAKLNKNIFSLSDHVEFDWSVCNVEWMRNFEFSTLYNLTKTKFNQVTQVQWPLCSVLTTHWTFSELLKRARSVKLLHRWLLAEI